MAELGEPIRSQHCTGATPVRSYETWPLIGTWVYFEIEQLKRKISNGFDWMKSKRQLGQDYLFQLQRNGRRATLERANVTSFRI